MKNPPFLGLFTVILLIGAPIVCAEEIGEQHYRRCAVCHLQDAQGIQGMFPPLAKRLGPLVKTEQGREYLVMVVTAGLTGNIKIKGAPDIGNSMPAQVLSDTDTAAVLNYVIETFNINSLPKTWERFTEAEIKAIRNNNPKSNPSKVYELRQLLDSKGVFSE